MSNRMQRTKKILYVIVLLFLILDSKNTIKGAREGIDLCLRSVIPAIFPSMFFSELIINETKQLSNSFISKLFSICKLPIGAQNYFSIGLLGGYPVGARLICQDHKKRKISLSLAEQAIIFCSNAGPAFIFGICGTLFENHAITAMLWLIHIISAVMSGMCLCKKDCQKAFPKSQNATYTFSSIIINCTKSMGIICGWIVIFRVLLHLSQVWILWLFSSKFLSIFTGLVELTNGITTLNKVADWQSRFIICSVLLAFGGICVLMQTSTILGKISIRNYLKGKILQAIFSLILGYIYIYIVNHINSFFMAGIALVIIAAFIITLISVAKKHVAISEKIIYNKSKAFVR